MAENKIRRLWSLFGWQFEEIESWLEDMAAKGWHLSHNGLFFAEFTKGEPQQVQYRCVYFKLRDLKKSERVTLYSNAGWEYVFRCGNAYIFRAPHSAQEIPGDSGDTRHTAVLERQLTAVLGVMGLVAGLMAYFLIRSWPLFLMGQTNSTYSWLAVLCYVSVVFFTIWLIVRSFLTLSRVRKGAVLRHKSYGVARWVNKAGEIMLLALFLLIISGLY